jgi:hypothetical protein
MATKVCRHSWALENLPVGTVLSMRRREDGRFTGQIIAPQITVTGSERGVRKLVSLLAKRYFKEAQTKGLGPITEEKDHADGI